VETLSGELRLASGDYERRAEFPSNNERGAETTIVDYEKRAASDDYEQRAATSDIYERRVVGAESYDYEPRATTMSRELQVRATNGDYMLL
jgi:hypothetical protein